MNKSEYNRYKKLQKNSFCSLESQNKLWSEGQKRFIELIFCNTVRDVKLLDIACGDGVGLRYFKEMGFTQVTGVEFNKKKSVNAKKVGFDVRNYDMHNLSGFDDGEFEIVYSSHTIEHAFDVHTAVGEMVRVLNKKGMMVVVLPYPDMHLFNIQAHVAKKDLGTDVCDFGKTVEKFFRKFGLATIYKKFDYFREPEIWLVMVKR